MKTSNKLLVGAMAIIALSYLIFLIALRANTGDNSITQGSGNYTRFNYETTSFHQIVIAGGFNVELTQGDTHSLEVECDDNMKEFIDIQLEEGRLKIAYKEHDLDFTKNNLYITVDSLSKIHLDGAVDLTSEGTFMSDTFHLAVNSASHATLSLNAAVLQASSYGAGEIKLTGEGNFLEVQLGGASKISAKDFPVKIADVEGNGSSDFQLHVIDSMNLVLSGNSNLEYRGTPRINSRLSGSSNMRSIR